MAEEKAQHCKKIEDSRRSSGGRPMGGMRHLAADQKAAV